MRQPSLFAWPLALRRLVLQRLLRRVAVAAVLAGTLSCRGEFGFRCEDLPGGCAATNGPPRLYVDPPFGVGFACVTLGCDTTRELTVENRGGGALDLSLLRLSVESSSDFQVALVDAAAAGASGSSTAASVTTQPMPTPDARRTLRAGEKVKLQVRYKPSDAARDEGAVWIDWVDAAVPYEDAVPQRVNIPLSSRVLGDAAADVALQRLNFGFVEVGQTATLDIAIVNMSTTNVLQFGPVRLDDTTPAVFGPPAGDTWDKRFVNPGERATIPVAFTPTTVDVFSGNLYVDTNDPAQSAIQIRVGGTAIAGAELEVTDPRGSLELGHVRLGESRTRDIVVRNRGGAPLVVTPSILEGQDAGFALFVQPGAPLPALAALEETTISVALTPTRGGPIGGKLLLLGGGVDSPPDQQRSMLVEMNAYGDAPDAAIAPGSVELGTLVQGWTAPGQTVSIRNQGTSELLITSIEFEVGSSSQIQVAGVPPLPIKLTPEDPPLNLTVFVVASALGPTSATLLVQTNSINEATRRVPIHAQIVTCEDGCPTAHGRPNCSAGRCEIGACDEAFHDADRQPGSGCECQEDVVGDRPRDISGACGGLDVGPLGDGCSDYANRVVRDGTLHDPDDVDVYFFNSYDTNGFFCDTFSDSYRLHVELLQAPAGVEFCIRTIGSGNGCGGENQRTCGLRSFDVDGGYGGDDSQDTTVWVRFSPGTPPMCGGYTLELRSRD